MHLFVSHNAPFITGMFTFLFWMMHCGIWNRCIVAFVNQVICLFTCHNGSELDQTRPDSGTMLQHVHWQKSTSTVRCRYNAVHILQKAHNRHPSLGCLLWSHMRYHIVITALDCLFYIFSIGIPYTDKMAFLYWLWSMCTVPFDLLTVCDWN